MTQGRVSWSTTAAIAILAIMGATAALLLIPSEGDRQELSAAAHSTALRPTGYAQLVSVNPLSDTQHGTDGETCPWQPASASGNLIALMQQNGMPDPDSEEGSATVEISRKPIRMIRDTDPIYTSVAVDTHYNEVILQDANLFGIKVFNRTDNTPKDARLTEPKRVIEGPKTHMQFNCGLYVDQNTGDIYSVEEDTGDRMIVFPHDAKGNVEPSRELKIPHRGFAVAVDEDKQEIYISIQYPPKVMVYGKQASGNEKPLRVLEGPNTKLHDVHGVAVDVKNQLLFVNNHGSDSDVDVAGSGKFVDTSITIYHLDADGDSPPLRVIEGLKTKLDWPGAMYTNPERGEFYVANDVGDSILVFRETDHGDAAPVRSIKGPKSGLRNPTGVYVDLKNNELWVSNMGSASASVFPLMANGDVAPLRLIRSAPLGKTSTEFSKPGAVAYDSKREEILAPN